jgi:hypothetical protein
MTEQTNSQSLAEQDEESRFDRDLLVHSNSYKT